MTDQLHGDKPQTVGSDDKHDQAIPTPRMDAAELKMIAEGVVEAAHRWPTSYKTGDEQMLLNLAKGYLKLERELAEAKASSDFLDSLDMNRLFSGDRRALNPKNQSVFDRFYKATDASSTRPTNELSYRVALDRAAYALFQIKRMVGVTDAIRAHVDEAHQEACKALDDLSDAPATNAPMLPELCAALGWQGGTIHQVVEEVKRLAQSKHLSAERADEMVPVADILAEIKHIEENGERVKNLPGMFDEGRCRVLCASYLRELIASERLRKKLVALGADVPPVDASDAVQIPRDVWDWLMGEGPDFVPTAKQLEGSVFSPGRYWWRSELRRRIEEHGFATSATKDASK